MPQQPCRFLARARLGARVLAESGAAVVVDGSEGDPVLWFPRADVRDGVLSDEDRFAERPGASEARLFGLAGGGAADLAWVCEEPDPRSPAPVGFCAFDPARVVLELDDPMGTDDATATTRKRFPTWGDAEDLVAVLDVQPVDEHRFVSVVRGRAERAVVEGSQMLGQAIVSAGRRHPGRRVVTAQMVFFRVADAAEPLTFDLDPLQAGRTFTTLGVTASQGGRRRAAGTVLLDVTSPAVLEHADAPPEVADPAGCPPCDMGVTGRDVRVADGAYTDDPDAPVGPPVLDAWVRFRPLPEDPALHAALLAQFTGHMSIATAMRPHAGVGQRDAHRTLSTAINAISLSFHADVRADRWMLYHHVSTAATAGMTHSACQVFDEDGRLLASFAVDAMVRAFATGAPSVEERRAL